MAIVPRFKVEKTYGVDPIPTWAWVRFSKAVKSAAVVPDVFPREGDPFFYGYRFNPDPAWKLSPLILSESGPEETRKAEEEILRQFFIKVEAPLKEKHTGHVKLFKPEPPREAEGTLRRHCGDIVAAHFIDPKEEDF